MFTHSSFTPQLARARTGEKTRRLQGQRVDPPVTPCNEPAELRFLNRAPRLCDVRDARRDPIWIYDLPRPRLHPRTEFHQPGVGSQMSQQVEHCVLVRRVRRKRVVNKRAARYWTVIPDLYVCLFFFSLKPLPPLTFRSSSFSDCLHIVDLHGPLSFNS